jgi:hypothetical protein
MTNSSPLRRLTRPLLILVAIVFLFEAWLWSHLEPIVAWIVALLPLKPVKEWLTSTISKLPPAATLVVFVVPFILLLPLKFLEVWLIVKHQWFAAIVVLVFAKLLGLGITAFIFEATKPKLLQLAWFRKLYELVLGWLAWAHALVDPIKARIKSMFRLFGPQRAGRTLRLLLRIRRRTRSRAAA